MEALFKRTGNDDFPKYIKGLLQGPPKSGKTSFLATCPNVVIADCETEANGLMSIAHLNIPYVEVSESNRLQQLLFVLRDDSLRKTAAEQMGMEKIETVCIDTIDALQKILKKERLRSERRTQMQREDWSWLLDQMREIINGFNALPLNVIYTVHTTTNQDDEQRMITMPALQGAIAEEVAGMVGYSMLMKRTREVDPKTGLPYTKYALKVEGDDKNPHLGNRASGRLPEEVEPDFRILQKAVFDGLQIAQAAVVAPLEITTTEVAQTPGQPEVQSVPVSAPVAPQGGDDEPINATALQHIEKMYGELGVPFDLERAKTMTLGEARNAVRMWVAVKKDHSEGKGNPGSSPSSEMIEYLVAMGHMDESPAGAEETPQEAPAPTTVEPKIDGTIDQVMAYVGEDLTKVQEAYDLEQQRDKPRATLVNALVNKGAKVQTPVVTETPQQAPMPVTSATPEADTAPTEEQALETVKEVLGGEVVSEGPTPDGADKPCEECGKPIDDSDIAVLSRSRFNRWLCVQDYITETRKPRTTV